MSNQLTANHSNASMGRHDGAGETRPSPGAWLRRAMPAAVVVALLAGVAWWGHASDWSFASFSGLLSSQPKVEDEWCAEHNVPEADCIECNVGLVAPGKDFGWCTAHGVPDCVLEHPELAQQHERSPATSDDLARAVRALALSPRIENSRQCDLHHHRIQFASSQAADKAGIGVETIARHRMIEAIVANGEITYDQTRAAHLSTKAPGMVWRVEKQVGEPVVKGDVLALVDAAEVGKAKADFLQALVQSRLKAKNLERLGSLLSSGAVPERVYREAETAAQEARIRLLGAQQALVNLGLPLRIDTLASLAAEEVSARMQFLGLPNAITRSLDPATTTSNLIPIRSPLNGIVVEREVVAGEVIDHTQVQFVVADVSRMWLTLNVRQEDARQVALGQSVLFRASGGAEAEEFTGAVAWISTSADERTRTVRVRVDLPNDDGRLRANTFGTGRIVLRDEPAAVAVPSDAVHSEGCCRVVFVRDRNYLDANAPKYFHVRKVRLGAKDGKYTEIIAGLLPGETIATGGSFVLAAQLLKSKLGEGCECGH